MLVTPDTVICTPARCGSNTANAVVGREFVVNPRHSAIYQDTDGQKRHRILLIRHPVDRLCSMFFFTTAHDYNHLFKFPALEDWLREWAEGRFTNAWTWNMALADYYHQFKPDLCVDVQTLCQMYEQERHLNKQKRDTKAEDEVKRRLRQDPLCKVWLEKDMEAFDYA